MERNRLAFPRDGKRLETENDLRFFQSKLGLGKNAWSLGFRDQETAASCDGRNLPAFTRDEMETDHFSPKVTCLRFFRGQEMELASFESVSGLFVYSLKRD